MANISKIVLPDESEYYFKDVALGLDVSTMWNSLSGSITSLNTKVDNNFVTLATGLAQKVDTSDTITTSEINQIWEAN